jgi:hypothetical protein
LLQYGCRKQPAKLPYAHPAPFKLYHHLCTASLKIKTLTPVEQQPLQKRAKPTCLPQRQRRQESQTIKNNKN